VTEQNPTRRRIRYVPVVGERLRKLLFLVFGLFALLSMNSVYLAAVTFSEWLTGRTYEDYFYQYMFLLHVVLGLLITVPVVVFGVAHIRNAWSRPNRRAVRAGLALFAAALLVLASGFGLLRLGFLEIRDPDVRSVIYWAHVVAPLAAAWLFVLHRLAGTRIRWRVGAAWAGVAVAAAVVGVFLQAQDPRRWNVEGPASGLQYFFPSLARTATGNFIPARTLMNDAYCVQCHPDIHRKWAHGVHRFSSFNNPAYLFSVRETREVALKRDGNVQASRFCAGCHDPVPFFSGAFDHPEFDDVKDPSSQAGITCTVCHAITNVNSPKGNADYTIEEPQHYPFAFSQSPVLRWVNRQLVKAKPGFHKKTFLKPLHRTAEFCGTCHKVHLPESLNHYKWLRGQNHYDSYLLSGVSGHGVASFYYPKKAVHDCAKCHMPLLASNDFGARDFDSSGTLKVHDHQFPSANTGVPALLGMPPWVNDAHREFLKGVMRVDVFGVREDGRIEGSLTAPLRPEVPVLQPGRTYLIEVVIRTVKMGHPFTQGTGDSNEVWLDVTADGGRVLGRSGGRGSEGDVDPWSHFVNAYVLDRQGRRIDRRNPQDIFVALYNHQIPPGATDVVHYRLTVPRHQRQPIAVDVRLQYRKFDTTYMRLFQGEAFHGNDLPVTLLAADRVVFPVAGGDPAPAGPTPEVKPWERWNDYGIGFLRRGTAGELRQAEEAFRHVEQLGRPEGPLNLGRVYLVEGRLDDAVAALHRAADHDPPAYPWSVAWFTGLVNEQNGYLDEALADFERLGETRFPEARRREFDFSSDYHLLNETGKTLFELAKRERGPARQAERTALLERARGTFEKTLRIDPENQAAHYNLSLVLRQLGKIEEADQHHALHEKYRLDDNAGDNAIAAARLRDPAANHAAQPVVIYDLQRAGAYELPQPVADVAGRRDGGAGAGASR